MSAAPKPRVIPPKPVAINNILFTTDFGPASETALRYAHAIAARHGSKIYLLHVLPPQPDLPIPLDKFPTEFDRTRQAATEHMVKLVAGDLLQDVGHDALLQRGPIEQVLATTIEQHDIDLVVTGTHGHRGFKKLVLGSVAEKIFREASCPVLTVGPEIADGEIEPGEFSHLLFATDFSPGSLKALPWALSFARQNNAKLTMLHVIQEVSEAGLEYLDEINAACKQRLTELLPPGAGAWCQPEFIVEIGPAADTILKVAEEQQADIIIMGARRTPMLAAATHLPWATAYRVVCQSHCPVLTVRSDE